MPRPEGELRDQLAVYLVADPELTGRDLLEDVMAALDGGVTAVQLRAKNMNDHDAWGLAIQLREQCHDHNALFLVNDRLDIALAAQADGVHLGASDLPVGIARWLTGPDFIIGYSPTTDAQAASATRVRADYVGIGPVFPTGSKADAGEAIGLETLAQRVDLAEVPAVGIGGITVENAPAVIRAGAVGVAVISAILGAPEPAIAAERLAGVVRRARAERQG